MGEARGFFWETLVILFHIKYSGDILLEFSIYFIIDIHLESVVPEASCIVASSIFNKRMEKKKQWI